MIETKEKVQLTGECEKLSVDFCGDNSGELIVSLTKNGDILMSVCMNSDDVKDFIRILQSAPSPDMVKLNDGRCEKRPIYFYINPKEGGKLGTSKRGLWTTVIMQLNKADEVQVGFVEMREVDMDLLIGSLYVWIGSNFLSSRTIHSMFEKSSFRSSKLDISCVRRSVDVHKGEYDD